MSHEEDTPKPLQSSKSWSRYDSTPQGHHRGRASTVGATIPEILHPKAFAVSPKSDTGSEGADVFTTQSDDGEHSRDDPDDTLKFPQTFEELPIEIRSQAESFLESLSARVHPTPIAINALAELFQDFYVRAYSSIDTHIAALSTRISRHGSTTSLSSKISRKAGPEQQMLTPTEIADRRKARKLLELKRTALEEAVERAVCEKVYSRIWRHRSTEDGERDEKLRSRTAALSVVGIGLKELLGHGSDITPEMRKSLEEKEEKLPQMLSDARRDIERMNNEEYPLGKLTHLVAAHKSIVEALSQIFPTSSSADEILPTLIYTLITSSPENLCAISNLHFIKRFRAVGKVDGEAAYCLVNLEASITFLENVDLSTLRADELPSGPGKSKSRPTTPRSEAPPMNLGITPAKANLDPEDAAFDRGASDGDRMSQLDRSQRRISHLIQSQTNRIENVSEAARQAVLDSADQAFDSINATVENSLKFLFGRLKEQQAGGPASALAQPKTLEDVRKLVSTPPPITDDNASATSSITEEGSEPLNSRPFDPKVTDLFGGRRRGTSTRERSSDSAMSGGSGSNRRLAFTPADTSNPLSGTPPLAPDSSLNNPNNGEGLSPAAAAPTPAPPVSPGASAVESMRNLGNSLNPLRGFGGINMLPRFGRSVTTPISPSPSLATAAPTSTASTNNATGGADATAPISSDTAIGGPIGGTPNNAKKDKALRNIEELSKTPPPKRKFIDCKDARDLKIGEVDDLLKEYQRLADLLRGVVRLS
ncbi:uncharacterized protein J3D65DRAFT_669738 [Phyllosticta citribraziliensis]|uniref:VPS9 domain-containing protein n=1 Tax=Phyllosticta citribraziliensis TaxID=989973 RepID=A0ABR1LFQ2_9PEZI